MDHPSEAISADGPLPTEITARTTTLAGSILETVESRLFATHRSPSVNASELGAFPTRTRAMIRPDPGLIFRTVAPS